MSLKKGLKKIKLRVTSNMELINPNTAGIDVGSEEHWVCIPSDRAKENVRQYGAFTSDLHAIANWLKSCNITSVAMESTGVYWIPLYNTLEDYGFTVFLVNPRDLKNVSGRTKTDKLDCQWIQKLHSYGLLKASFIPGKEISELRSLYRHRENLVKDNSKHIQHMQKVLHEMNILLDKVISDISGETGMRIIKAICKGERRPLMLVKLKDSRIHATDKEIEKALTGNYRDEQVFILKQEFKMYEFVKMQIEYTEREIEKLLKKMKKKVDKDQTPIPPNPKEDKKSKKNQPSFDLRSYLYEVTGVDLTLVDGFSVTTVLGIISEVGYDMTRWKDEKYFSSWLGVSPNKAISGGKILSEKTKKVKSNAAYYFRLAAGSLKNAKCYLGDFYRRIKARSGPSVAIVATAHKLAVIFYKMLKEGKPYKALDRDHYIKKNKARSVKNLKRYAEKLGFDLIPQMG